jgi:hypothetical protein
MVGCLSKVMGVLLIPLGLWLDLTILGFASLIDPSLPKDEWWAEYWGRISWGGLGMNLVMIALGVWLVVVPPGTTEDPAPKRLEKQREGKNHRPEGPRPAR